MGVASLDAIVRFDIRAGTITLFLSFQLLIYLAVQIPSGLLADSFGPRRILATGLICIGIGEAIFGLSTTLYVGLFGRAIVGLGDALIFLNVLRLIGDWFPGHRYPYVAALAVAFGACGQLFTTTPLQTALEIWGWTPTFLLSGLITIIMGGALWIILADCPRDQLEADSYSPTVRTIGRGLGDTSRIVENKRALWVHLGLFGPFLTFTSLWGFPYMVEGQGVSRGSAARLLALAVAVFAVGAPIVGWAASRTGRREPFIGTALVMVGVFWIGALAWPGGTLPPVVLWLLVAVTGAGGATSLLAFDMAREATSPDRVGSAMGFVNIGGFGGTALSNFSIGGLLSLVATGHSAVSAFGTGAFQIGLLPIPGMAIIGAIQAARLGVNSLHRHG